MYIYWNPDPVALSVFGISIWYYSLLFIMGTVLSVWVLKRIYREVDIPWGHLQILVVLSVCGLFLGARLGHCLIYDYAYYFSHPLEIFVPVTSLPEGGYVFHGFRGMASHGGLVGWMIALFAYSRITGEKVIRTLDSIALVLPLGACFIRLGNLMNSEMIGYPTDVSWAFVFERVDLFPRHPAQLYEAVGYLGIFGLNMFLYRNVGLDRFRGVFWGLTLVLVFGVRFLIEFLKEHQEAFEDQMGLDLGQWLSIPFILLGIGFVVYAFRSKLKHRNV